MRQWIAIILLGLFTFSGTEVHQLLKLPMLFQHYAEHQAEGRMDWLNFLAEHYLHERHHHASDDHHHELPFHCDHHCGAQTVQASIAQESSPAVLLCNGLDVQLNATEDRIPPREGPDGIWRPPKA